MNEIYYWIISILVEEVGACLPSSISPDQIFMEFSIQKEFNLISDQKFNKIFLNFFDI